MHFIPEIIFGLYLPAVPFCGNADFDADVEEEGEPEETAPPEEWSGITGYCYLILPFVFLGHVLTLFWMTV